MNTDFDQLKRDIKNGLFDNDLDTLEALVELRRTRMMEPQRVLIGFVLDKSGSMGTIAHETVTGFNEWLDEAKRTMPDALLTLTLFDTEYQTRYENAPIRSVKSLSNFNPYGMTALLDAVGDTITRMEQEERSGKYDKVLLIVQTDGYENSSTRFSAWQIRQLIEKHTQDGWTFVALGADVDAWASFSQLGFGRGNVIAYAGAATSDTFRTLAQNTATYAAAPAGGGAATDFWGGDNTDDDEPELLAGGPAGTGG